MAFVYVRSLSNKGVGHYVAESEIVAVDYAGSEVTLRDGKRYAIAEEHAGERLLSKPVVGGVTLDGTIIQVPISSIDHVTDRFDEEVNDFIAIAETMRGIKFIVGAMGRSALGLDDEVFDVGDLQRHASRLRGEKVEADPEIEAAAERATATPTRKVEGFDW